MADTTMAELLATAKLGFEINTQPNPELDCTLCGGRLDGIFGDNRWVAVTLILGTPEVGRICQDCTEKRKPGMWEIAEGMDQIFTGLLQLPQAQRALTALQIGGLVAKLAEFDQVEL